MIPILENEIWLPVKGFEEYLEVSNMGRVKHLYRETIRGCKRGRYIKKEQERITYGCLKKGDNGYLSISKTVDGKRTEFRVHVLVGEAFIPNPENKATINHKRGTSAGNGVDNLEWATYSEQHFHAYRELNRQHVSRPVKCPTLDISFKSITEASVKTGIDESIIGKICRGKNIFQSGGLVFNYI